MLIGLALPAKALRAEDHCGGAIARVFVEPSVAPQGKRFARVWNCSPITRFRLARLQKARAVVAAGEGRFYLDAAAYARYRRARQRRALNVIAVASLLLVFLWWRGVVR